jgi:hypothetical protein
MDFKVGDKTELWHYGAECPCDAEVIEVNEDIVRFRVTSKKGRTTKVSFDKDSKDLQESIGKCKIYHLPLTAALREE